MNQNIDLSTVCPITICNIDSLKMITHMLYAI